MISKNIGLTNRLSKKNFKDTVILGVVTVLIIAYIMFIEDKPTMVLSSIATLFVYFVQYQMSKSELLRSIDKLIDNELKEFQKISVKVLQLSEKQRQLTNKYMEMLNNVVQTTKTFRTSTIQSKEKTQNISTKIKEAYEFSEHELKSVQENIQLTQNIKLKIQIIAELIIELTDYIKQIGSTVSIVENISEQTNMLALNAAVEAARAGEYGKGFAVVAGEIRKLADESKQATNKITSLVAQIEQTTSSTIMATEESAKEADSDVKFVNNINSNISSLTNNIKTISYDLNEILSSSITQQTLTDDVIDVISDMQKGISETLQTLEENIENIRVFSEISSNIKDNIAN